MMSRIYISADIEGTCGIAHWDETEIGKPGYDSFRRQMTAEVRAACEGAQAGGSDGVYIKDAHDSARNLIPGELPEGIQLFRGWGSDLHSMVSGLDASFSGVIFTGYHSSSNTDASPLAHTMNLGNTSVRINGIQASEMVINAFAAAYYDVPLLMVTGDLGVCEQAKRLNPNIVTVPVQQGRGNGTVSIHPAEAVRHIRAAAEQAVRDGLAHPEKYRIDLPNKFDVEIEYRLHQNARRAGFYPGAKQVGPRTVRYSSDAYYDVLRFFLFCL